MLKNCMVWTALILGAVFWIVGPMLSRGLLFDMLNAMLIAVGTGVVIAYGPGVVKTLRLGGRQIDTGHVLVIGIVAAWTGTVIRTTSSRA